MTGTQGTLRSGEAAVLLPASAGSRSTRRLRALWVGLWSVMLFAPSVMIGFTATQSKFSLASIIATIYVFSRLLFRPLPPMTGATGFGLLLAIFLLIHAIVLTAWTGNAIVLLLEGQWAAYLLAGLLLTLDMVQTRSDIEWAGKAMFWLGVVAASLGIASIWTGPFYSYANHFEGRWGFLINRACGTFESPAMLSSFLLIAFALLFFTAPPARGSVFRHFGLVLMAVTLLLTQARGSILAAIATVVLGIPTAAKRRAAMLKILAVTAIAGLIVYASSTYLVELGGLTVQDAQSRADVGKPILEDFADDFLAPQLFGIGFRQSASIDPETGMWFTAHNSYISLLREIGLVGCTLFGGLVVFCLLHLSRRGSSNWAFALISLLVVATTEGYLFASFCVFFLGCVGGIADRLRQLSAAPAAFAGFCTEPL